MAKKIYKNGVRFDCPECGKLWKEDEEHAPHIEKGCLQCTGSLRLVGKGDNPMMVGDANWYRCLDCGSLFMQRRGEVVETTSRAGFAEYTEFTEDW